MAYCSCSKTASFPNQSEHRQIMARARMHFEDSLAVACDDPVEKPSCSFAQALFALVPDPAALCCIGPIST